MNEIGIESNPDNLFGVNVGAWNMINAIDPQSQARSFSADAYYLPVAHRPDLHLVTEAMAMEVLLDKAGPDWVAKAVRVKSKDGEFTVSAKRDIIISAGSVQSPQLLEVSGIGNRRYWRMPTFRSK